MLALRQILFPTDYGPGADRAFAHAAFLAGRHDADLAVLHVRLGHGGDTAPPRAYDVPTGVDVSYRVVEARSVGEAVVAQAREADLVAMGTHGRRGLRRAVVGSTAEHVLRHADCPVLAVRAARHGAAPVGPPSVDRVLVPVDFSDSSGPALLVADALAACYGARVDVVHAVQFPGLPTVYGLGPHFEPDVPAVVERVREALADVLRHAVAAERRGEVAVRVSAPGPTILDEVERTGAGLLVMPTHGRTGLARLALGSVAEHVLRRAPCPVLTVPSFGRVPLFEAVPAERRGEPAAS